MDSAAELDALLDALRLKSIDRAGWRRKGLERPESVAAHSWGISWLVLALLPDELNLARALAYAAVHDVPEVRVGDLTPHDGISPAEKRAREQVAMRDLCASLPRGARLESLFHAYEAQNDAEARFVRQLDRLDMALQAVIYAEADGHDLQEFVASAQAIIDHPRLVALVNACAARVASATRSSHRTP
jgi:putative hydrolase of HD superfamily